MSARRKLLVLLRPCRRGALALARRRARATRRSRRRRRRPSCRCTTSTRRSCTTSATSRSTTSSAGASTATARRCASSPAPRRRASRASRPRGAAGLHAQGLRLLPAAARGGPLRALGAPAARRADEARVLPARRQVAAVRRRLHRRAVRPQPRLDLDLTLVGLPAREQPPWRRGTFGLVPCFAPSASASPTTPSTWGPATTASTPSRTPSTRASKGSSAPTGCCSSRPGGRGVRELREGVVALHLDDEPFPDTYFDFPVSRRALR